MRSGWVGEYMLWVYVDLVKFVVFFPVSSTFSLHPPPGTPPDLPRELSCRGAIVPQMTGPLDRASWSTSSCSKHRPQELLREKLPREPQVTVSGMFYPFTNHPSNHSFLQLSVSLIHAFDQLTSISKQSSVQPTPGIHFHQ